MSTSIDNLLTQYDTGKLSRRRLLAAIALIAASRPARAQSSLFRARSLSHVNIGVSDLAASEAFYRKLLGSPPNRPIVGDAFALDFAESGFISLCPQPGGSCSVAGPSAQPGRIDHFGVGIDDFDADRVMSELEADRHRGCDQRCHQYPRACSRWRDRPAVGPTRALRHRRGMPGAARGARHNVCTLSRGCDLTCRASVSAEKTVRGRGSWWRRVARPAIRPSGFRSETDLSASDGTGLDRLALCQVAEPDELLADLPEPSGDRRIGRMRCWCLLPAVREVATRHLRDVWRRRKVD